MTCGCHSHNGMLTAKGREVATAQRKSSRSTGLTDRDFFAILDEVGSVSALVEGEAPVTIWPSRQFIRQQDRRFHNGS